MPEPTQQTDLREQFGLSLGALGRAWRNRANERLKPLGLSYAQWLTLNHLAQSSDGLGQSELARRIGIEGPTLVRLLDRLTAAGWVLRQPSLSDRRCKRVHLAENRRPLLNQARASIAQLRQQALSDFSDPELAAGADLMRRLKEKLETL